MTYGFASSASLTTQAYMISLAYCFPCSSLGPTADVLVDLNHPSAQMISIPVPTGSTFSYPMVISPSLNGLQFFVQMLGGDAAGNLHASNAISQTIGLRPVE
jgi:hypothetical protein